MSESEEKWKRQRTEVMKIGEEENEKKTKKVLNLTERKSEKNRTPS